MDATAAAYEARAQEYADLLGHADALAEPDRALVTRWAATCGGPILDAGCGPGHWTALLRDLGHAAEGVDPAPSFVEIARDRHPGVSYRAGSFDDLGPGRYAGVLAWFSLIHLHPDAVPGAVGRLRDALAPGGSLLLGFFDGDEVAPFDHAITTAYFWPVGRMSELVEGAGLEVVHTEQRRDPGARRAVAAVWARAPEIPVRR